MATLKEDIKTQSDWIVKAFLSDGYKLDYSVRSLIEIDKFFEKNSRDGNPIKGGRLEQNCGPILFSIGSYVGETFIKIATGSEWITDDNDPQGEITATIKFPDGFQCWPMERVIKRYKNGLEDSIYVYGYELTKKYMDEPFDQTVWEIYPKDDKKPWWKIW